MIKRFYQSAISLKYSFPLMASAIVVIALAMKYTNDRSHTIRLALIFCTCILAGVMFFYYRDKYMMNQKMKKIPNIDEFEYGGMVGRSYILEDRMIACYKTDPKVVPTDNIVSVTAEDARREQVIFTVDTAEGTYKMSADSRDQAEHFAAFLKRKNPAVVLNGVVPAGNGTLKEIGGVEGAV